MTDPLRPIHPEEYREKEIIRPLPPKVRPPTEPAPTAPVKPHPDAAVSMPSANQPTVPHIAGQPLREDRMELSYRVADILFPIDPEHITPAFLQYAFSFAASQEATLHLVHIAGTTETETSILEKREHLSALTKQWAYSNVFCESHVEQAENVAEMICKVAERLDCALILIPTHARKGLDRLLLGSVAENVIRNASCPVLVLK